MSDIIFTKRGEKDIMYDILKTIENKKGTAQYTQLLQVSNTSTSLLNNYLIQMIKRKLITEHKNESGRKMFKTLVKGFDYVRLYEQLIKTIKED